MFRRLKFSLLTALIVGAFCNVDARPQQFSQSNWNQFPNFGTQWNRPNPNNPFFPPSQLPPQQQQQQQQQPQIPNNPGGGFIGSTTQAPATATTASPAFLACMQRCATTMEYNPVCGSDGINYHNDGRLRCATHCGKSVVATRMGTCSPL